MLSSLSVSGAVHAQPAVQAAVPDAARLLRETQSTQPVSPAPNTTPQIQSGATAAPAGAAPAPADAASRRIAVKKLVIYGVSAQSQKQGVSLAEIQAILARGDGQALTFADLNQMADRVTAYYAALGFDLARAYVPAQEIRDGVVTIAVVEGILGKVSIDNQTKYPQAAIERTIKGLVPGDAIRRQNLETQLLMISDVPGVDVTGILKAGTQSGETDIVLRVMPARALTSAVDFDNFGGKTTGVYRTGISMAMPSESELGRQTNVRVMSTGRGMNLANIAWQTPIGGLEDKFGISFSTLGYKLGDSFEYLQASGQARTLGLSWTHSFARDHQNSRYSLIDVSRRVMNDRKAAVNSLTNKTATVLTASFGGFYNGEGRLASTVAYNFSLIAGTTQLNSTESTVGAQTGRYSHFNTNVTYQKALAGKWSAALMANGQQATQNQDSGERIGLGGPTGVRAYPGGEGGGDRGIVANAELRYNATLTWQVSGFYDAGVSVVQVNPPAGSTAANTRHLSGAGFGLQYSLPRSSRIKAALAWRTSADAPVSDSDRKPRLWVNGVVYF